MNAEFTDYFPDDCPPGGFEVAAYLLKVKDLFTDKFQPKDPKDLTDKCPRFKDICFGEEHDFEKIEMALPGVLLDLQGAKLNPTQGEYRHSQQSIHSNKGNLALWLYMHATIVVNNRIPDPNVTARQLAFDVAAFVNAQSRLGSPTGMSQVYEIAPVEQARRDNIALIAWRVKWQHSIEFSERKKTDKLKCPEVMTIIIGNELNTDPDSDEEYEVIYRKPMTNGD